MVSGTAGNRPDRQAEAVARELAVLAGALGDAVRSERNRRRLTLQELSEVTGLGRSTIADVEAGHVASLETYVRLGRSLNLRREFTLADSRRPVVRAKDPVHAAMGEIEARHLRRDGREIRLDEPYQHYQFAGRADLAAWEDDQSSAAFLHLENRTRFPDRQEAFGSFGAKCAYLAPVIAERAEQPRFASQTHVVVALWSAEVLHELRLHPESFRAACPDPPDAFEAWWSGRITGPGLHRTIVVLDPLEGRRRDRRRFVGLDEALCPSTKPRYRGYADALEALRQAGLA